MSVNKIKQEIRKCEKTIELETQMLDELRQQIVEEIKPFIKFQLKKNVETEVKSNSEHTKELGRDKLSVMKQQLSALLDRSDNLVEEVFSNDNLWIHVNYAIGNDWSAYSNQQVAGGKIHKAIKMILGEAGKLLVENGYMKVGSVYQFDSDSRRNFDLADSKLSKANLIFKGYLPIPEELGQLIGKYTKEIETLHKLYCKVLKLKTDLSEQEAADLWDEA